MGQDTQLWKKYTSEKPVHEKTTSLLCECNVNIDLVSSRSKLAQEAIAGWEKAEAEAMLRKQELNDVLQQKIVERVSFYADLKDQIMQLSYAREELEKTGHGNLITAPVELEKEHEKLEEEYVETSKIVAGVTLENSQLKKALQMKERLINDASEQMTQATREFNILMAKQDSVEKENAILRYELQFLEKKVCIQNEELELNRRSFDKLEDKYSKSKNKIRRLESECQSLRVLVRKRPPGPTGLEEIKSEVKVQRRVSDKIIRLMMERACDFEEENKILKENAGSKNEELCSLRTTFAMLNSKLSQVEKENTLKRQTVRVSDMSLMDCFGEMEKLAIVPVNKPYQAPCDSTGKELAPVKECKSSDLSTENPSDWLQNVVNMILEQTRISNRSIDEIWEDVRVSLKFRDCLATKMENEVSKPLSGYINRSSSLDVENFQESKRLVEDQLENQKVINEDLDTQLTVSKFQLNELLRNLSFLEVELEDKSHYCEKLEAICLEFQVQLERYINGRSL